MKVRILSSAPDFKFKDYGDFRVRLQEGPPLPYPTVQAKASEVTRHIPVIHVTATSRGERYRREAISAGADMFLEEPVSADELLRAVNGLIDRFVARAGPGRVLVLSPYPDECDLYGEALKAAGYQNACGSPENGESLVRAVMPDLVVTRIRPGDSGLRLARSLQDNQETARIPVVIITTYPDAARRAQPRRSAWRSTLSSLSAPIS